MIINIQGNERTKKSRTYHRMEDSVRREPSQVQNPLQLLNFPFSNVISPSRIPESPRSRQWLYSTEWSVWPLLLAHLVLEYHLKSLPFLSLSLSLSLLFNILILKNLLQTVSCCAFVVFGFFHFCENEEIITTRTAQETTTRRRQDERWICRWERE